MVELKKDRNICFMKSYSEGRHGEKKYLNLSVYQAFIFTIRMITGEGQTISETCSLATLFLGNIVVLQGPLKKVYVALITSCNGCVRPPFLKEQQSQDLSSENCHNRDLRCSGSVIRARFATELFLAASSSLKCWFLLSPS